ncbi:polymer-forming cytoskeletal protein [Candidatus Uhrbacteria bacterium]|jgi:cytoskeletal protein CcmA (bactofilin family)|nr:polymer-forming cytoskeletal protein [Candidatus Uhrbacteria bacterium]
MAKSTAEETIIARGVRVEGDFKSQGAVLIEGEVAGNVQIAGDLRVGDESKIHADVVAQNAVVGGEVRGNIQVAGRLELLSSAKMIGDVTADVLSVQAGALVNGKITMDGREVKMPKVESSDDKE